MDIGIKYLTHSVPENFTILERILYPYGEEPLTRGQMFFKPYKSIDEFGYCGFRTVYPLLLLGLLYLFPHVVLLVAYLAFYVFIYAFMSAAVGMLFDPLCDGCARELKAKAALDVVLLMVSGLVQLMIDSLVLPLSVSIMVTRGIATGLDSPGLLCEEPGSGACSPR